MGIQKKSIGMIPKEELIITPQMVTNALSKLPSDQSLAIIKMAKVLTAKIDGITIEDALILLAEIESQPNKIKKLKELSNE